MIRFVTVVLLVGLGACFDSAVADNTALECVRVLSKPLNAPSS